MKKIMLSILLVISLCGCGNTYDGEARVSPKEAAREEWISQFNDTVLLYYQYDYPTYSWNYKVKKYCNPDGWIVRYRGKFRGHEWNIYVQTYTLPGLTEEDYIILYYDKDNKYEFYIDFSNIDYDYTIVKHMSDEWYSYIGENGVCTSNLE